MNHSGAAVRLCGTAALRDRGAKRDEEVILLAHRRYSDLVVVSAAGADVHRWHRREGAIHGDRRRFATPEGTNPGARH